MLEWIRTVCVKCQHFNLFKSASRTKILPIMIPKVSFLLFLGFGVACAFIASLLPNLTALFFGPSRQLTDEHAFTPFHAQRFGFGPQYKEYFTAALKRNSAKPNPDLRGEALAALHLARDMSSQSKFDKARKLYEHAMALDSSQADILNEYGEFLESHQKDVVSAEHLYCLALSRRPDHTKALANRKRTQPLVEEIDQNRFNRIDAKLNKLIQVPDNHPGLRRMKQEMYFMHIYHTTAIEGNTFTLSQTRSLVETRMAIGGKSVMEHNEILGMDAALHYLNSSLVHRIGAISKDDILEIHKRVLGHVDPVEAGRFRTSQVFVGDHVPPAAGAIDGLMDEFIDWLNSDEAINLHPIEFAAIAHYKLVYIHPFYDGNGRTSRLLMNLILMTAGYPPIIIKVEDKHIYYQHLETANNGDMRPFIRFIASCTERTIDDYIWGSLDHTSLSIPELDGFHDDGRTIILENDAHSEQKKEKP